MSHWFQFMKPEHSWLCGYPLECGWSTRGHALKENRLSFRSHQVSVSPLLEVGTWDSSPLHAGMFTGLIFCSCCPGNHRSWEIRECNHPAMSREHKVNSPHPLTLTDFLLPSSLMASEPWEEEVWSRCPVCEGILHWCSLTWTSCEFLH